MKKSVGTPERQETKTVIQSVYEAKPESGRHAAQKQDSVSDDQRKQERLRMVEKRRDRSRSISLSLFVLIVMLLTVVLILNIMNRNAPDPQFMFIQNGIIEHNITTNAIIIREENILKSPDNGYLKPMIQGGSRVSSGQTVAVIIRDGSEDDLATLKNYDQQIADLQMELVMKGKGTGAAAVYDEADGSISTQIDLVRRDGTGMIFTSLSSYRTSIDVAMSRRDTRLLNIDFKDATLKELKIQKEKLEKDLGVVAGNIIVSKPGILSYSLDGMEVTLSPKFVEKMNPDEFSKYSEGTLALMTAGEYRKKDADAVKIITGIYQYIALVLPETEDGNFPTDSRHTIKVPGTGTSIEDCIVFRKIIQGGQLLVIFRTDRMIVRFADTRYIQALLTIKSAEGLRIPYSSVMNISDDGLSGDIMLVVSGYARKIHVKIIDSDSEYAIIEASEKENQTVLDKAYLVKNPESVTEGENIGG
ncbi:MAG: HlyD family efflux transporter periplasmic adaptor subunit [Saccharofermentanales bacterium]